MKFSDLGLSEKTLKAIAEVGYEQATPIQEQAIPQILKRNDVLGIAQTGTGKTAAFTLPMIDILSNGRAKALMPRTLILSPTRELATQIADCFKQYGKYQKLSMALLIGGESMIEQQKILSRGVDVLIATPGRMIDLCERGRILLRDVQIFVLDEADRMLDMGFIPDVEKIATKLPAMRQTLLFSATMLPEIKKLASQFMRFPVEIRVDPEMSTADTVEQFLVKSNYKGKREVLRSIIHSEEIKNAMVFCNRKRDVDILLGSFKKHKFSVVALHGDMTQSQRTETLRSFKDGEAQFLICSDVAARGLDLPDVSHVFNFDVPLNCEDYIHRIGRTGRAGKTGKAFMLVTSSDFKTLGAIEKLIGKKIEEKISFSTEMDAAPEFSKKRNRKKKSFKERKKEAQKKVENKEFKAEKTEQKAELKEFKAERTEQKEQKALKPKKQRNNNRPQKKEKPFQKKQEERKEAPASVAFGGALPAFLMNEINV